MPSPFPGMDPYLEDPWLWADFHLTYIVTLRTEMNRQLPMGYVCLADRYVWVQEQENGKSSILGKPDLFVTGQREQSSTQKESATAIQAPVEVLLPSLTEKGSPYLKVIDRDNRRLVTVIELLSPANKAKGKDRDAIIWKRCEYLASGVNLVEMDFLEKGKHLLGGLPPESVTDYYIMVSKATERPHWHLAGGLRSPLPTVNVPLNPDTPDIPLSLQACMNQAYDDAGYAREIDYRQPPNPPLSESDQTWSKTLLAEKRSIKE